MWFTQRTRQTHEAAEAVGVASRRKRMLTPAAARACRAAGYGERMARGRLRREHAAPLAVASAWRAAGYAERMARSRR
jgi:hypothetical protein